MLAVPLNIKLIKLISNVFFRIILILFVFSVQLSSQWCIPSITETFNHGVRNINFNGIDRTSGLAENYVNTGLSTTVARGSTYQGSVSLGFGVFCSAGNVRIWIDFNRDYDFEDAGELVYTANNMSTVNPITFSVNVPADAYLGTTRMRVTSKMMVSCGHTLPDPCNNPPDPIGYHGEVEDYDFIIINPTGISIINSSVPDRFDLFQNYPNPFNPVTNIRFDIASRSDVKIVIYDVTGRTADVLVNESLEAGSYEANWNASGYPSGVYYYSLTAGNYFEVQKMVLVK